MTLRHVIVSLAAVCTLACSSDDTVVSLNVASTDDVPVVGRLHVTITQGSRTHEREFEPPIETPTGDDAPPPSIKNKFFERIVLPEGWEEKQALVRVVAMQADGSPFEPALEDETTVTIQPEGVVAANVQFAILSENMGGAGGAGGASSEGGGGGTGGAMSEGGTGGVISEGGTGGVISEGGAGGVITEGGAGGLADTAGAGGQ